MIILLILILILFLFYYKDIETYKSLNEFNKTKYFMSYKHRYNQYLKKPRTKYKKYYLDELF